MGIATANERKASIKKNSLSFERVDKGDFFLYDEVLFVKTGESLALAIEDGGGFTKGSDVTFHPDEEVRLASVDFYC